MFKKHLSLGHLGRIQFEIERHPDLWEVHHKGNGLPNLTSRRILERQMEHGGMGGHHTKPAPARKSHAGLDEMEQRGIQPPENGRSRKPSAGPRKRLCADLALEFHGPLEVSGKTVEFLL